MKDQHELPVIEVLMQYAAAPNDPELERQAKSIIADHFDNPPSRFKSPNWALARDALLKCRSCCVSTTA